ncbi:MAG: methylmalonyl-CoA mutase family protein [Woeseiaceae bacterium]
MSATVNALTGNASGSDRAPLRFVTAASLFDGHDAAINIMRRLIQSKGAEVIHLGHNRSVEDVVRAAIQEDADGIAISSYQGGHNEYFRYMVDMLKAQGASHIKVFGGGGGTITPEEISDLMAYGVARIYHPNDGMQLGLDAMIDDLISQTEQARNERNQALPSGTATVSEPGLIAATISAIETGGFDEETIAKLRREWSLAASVPVIGITGTGGAGKSSVTDEILNRFTQYFPERRIAVVAVDPTRRRTGGALLGDRIRMNTLRAPTLYMRSIATRRQHLATSEVLGDVVAFLKSTGFDLVVVETAGIGQSDSEIVDLVDFSMYVMTSDYGAASQLEKIDMIDFADLIVLNKYDKRGAEDALRDIRKQWRRNRLQFQAADEDVPVYPTIASQFNDPGLTYMFSRLCEHLASKLELATGDWGVALPEGTHEPRATALIPGARNRYLAEISEQGRSINESVARQAESASQAQHVYESLRLLEDPQLPEPLGRYPAAALTADVDASVLVLRQRYQEAVGALTQAALDGLATWPDRREGVRSETYSYTVRGKEITGDNYRRTLSNQRVPKIAAPMTNDWGEQLRFLLKENLPGAYPYTAGVYPYRRTGEDPIRMFAGEGTPERTNRRFHFLSKGQAAARLSTAFDSVTLYGEDPHERPDIFGKVGNAGVSIATLDDMKKLYSGFDLCSPSTSVSMTINGPAPMILAFFMNTAIDQQIERHLDETNGWAQADETISHWFDGKHRPTYDGDLPADHDGLGLRLLGIPGRELVDEDTYAEIKKRTLASVRGTVQADILKEDQAQNTCIFSTEFALKMMGDVQQYFIDHNVRNYYSVSISGYHIAEAGANPISQLAFTLSNGFTIVEYYLSRGMNIDDFAPNLSFFFSNGMDPEYAVIGRVARRIWARAMRERYGAGPRSQMMKYHIQTSGRSLHAQEISFNDIRTTLQALYALFDNCNSLHTNAFDEAITTPTEQSVRRAVAIQLIINRELGLNFCENPLQGAYVIDELTDLVEEAVYQEFDRISERGGVLGAMDTMYQRGKIQDESMFYESKKHDGSLPLIGVNTFLPPAGQEDEIHELELMRSTDDEKHQQIKAVRSFQSNAHEKRDVALKKLMAVATARENIFEALVDVVQYCSLGEISASLYGVGGEYRRNM